MSSLLMYKCKLTESYIGISCLCVCVCAVISLVMCMYLQLWEAASGKCVATLVGHKEEVLDVCFDLNGHLIASASADGET